MTQNYATVHELEVVPGKPAKGLRISQGKWCLSSLSTVPYVTLTGSGFSKTFSWGEMIEVPEGASVQAINASSHKGDIYLNAGWDYSNAPKRISVPVQLEVIDPTSLARSPYPPPPAGLPAVGTIVTTEYAVDTRRAVRAFLSLLVVTGASDLQFVACGMSNTSSFDTFNQNGLLPPPFPLQGYASPVIGLAATQGFLIPLGMGAGFTSQNFPHALLDKAQVFFTINDEGITLLPTAMYLLEY